MSKFTTKQQEVLDCIKNDMPKILVTYGAKRAGKTHVLSLAFLGFIAKHENENKNFILGGVTYSTIWRNILEDWQKWLGIEIKLSKYNSFNLFGNNIYVLGGSKSNSWETARGFTAQGAFLNEATALDETFVKECISRCSEEGSVVYMDTNPENPIHYVKTDYIDKDGQRLKSGKLNIKAFHFTLDDNTKISEEYKESIKAATPQGVFYDRDIKGLWVSPEGVIYSSFRQNVHIIKREKIQDLELEDVWCGVDWGYEHKGSITVLGRDKNNNFYLLKEIVSQHKEIDWWVERAKEIKRHYKKEFGNIRFYCDSARPEHVARFQREGLKAFNANKKVLAGIEVVAKLLKVNRLFICEDCKETIKEFNLYVWNDKTGEPIKINDDCMDSLRYALYSYYILNQKIFGF